MLYACFTAALLRKLRNIGVSVQVFHDSIQQRASDSLKLLVSQVCERDRHTQSERERERQRQRQRQRETYRGRQRQRQKKTEREKEREREREREGES